MHNQYFESLLKFVAKAKPLVASLTVFAYVNAFILPITAASADPAKYEEERKARIVARQKKVTEPAHSGLMGTVKKGLGVVSSILFSPSTEDTKDVALTVTHKNKYQKGLIQEFNGLKQRLGKIQSYQGLDDSRKAYKIPTLSKTPTPQEKFKFIGQVLSYIQQDTLDAVTYFREAKLAERKVQSELKSIEVARKALLAKVTKKFSGSKKDEVKNALTVLSELIIAEKKNSKEELKFLEFYLEEECANRAQIEAAMSKLDETKPLSHATSQFKQILSFTESILPEELQETIKQHKLNLSVAEELEESDIDVVSALGTTLKVLTSPTAAKVVVALGMLQFAPIANAAMTLVNPNPPTFNYLENQPTDAPVIQIQGAVNDNLSLVRINTKTTTGIFDCSITTPDVVCVLSPANPAMGQTDNLLSMSGNMTQINLHLENLRLVPGNNLCPVFASSGFSASDGTTTRFGTYNYACTQVNEPPVAGPCAVATVSPGGTVPLTAAMCPVTDTNGVTDAQITLNVQTTNGFFNFINNPTVRLTSFTWDDVKTNKVQFTADSSNLQPIVVMTVCDTTNTCSTGPANFTVPFSATQPTTSAIDSGTLWGAVGAAIAVVTLIASGLIGLGIYKNNAKKSRNPYRVAKALYTYLNLDCNNFESGPGETFKNCVGDIVAKIEEDGVNLNGMNDDELVAFMPHLGSAISNRVDVRENSWWKKIIWGANKINLEGLNNQETRSAIAGEAVAKHMASFRNSLKINPLAIQSGAPLKK